MLSVLLCLFNPVSDDLGPYCSKSLLCHHKHLSFVLLSVPISSDCGIYGIFLFIWRWPQAVFSCHSIQEGIISEFYSILVCL